MNWKKISILFVLLVVADKALKIWIKTNMHLGESITVFEDWFQLLFVENNGAAFGMQIANNGGFDWGKLFLSLFRVGLVGAMFYYINYLLKQKAPNGVIIGLVLIEAGAIGNIIDSAFYGLIFSASTPATVAHFGGSYAPFMMGRVVDMFYFPLIHNSAVEVIFFRPVFNFADTCITCAVFIIILFYAKDMNSSLDSKKEA